MYEEFKGKCMTPHGMIEEIYEYYCDAGQIFGHIFFKLDEKRIPEDQNENFSKKGGVYRAGKTAHPAIKYYCSLVNKEMDKFMKIVEETGSIAEGIKRTAIR